MPEAESNTALLVGTAAHVASLSEEILSPERTRPVVVVTAKPGANGPYVNGDALAAAVGELASVWVLDDADLTWQLTEALPQKLDVYGGAARVYNPIEAGDSDPYPSDHPQWSVFGREEGEKVVRLIAAYVELTTRTPLPEFGSQTTAIVTTVRKAGAELDLATGHPGFVSIGHLVQHGEVFHAADVLQVGQEVPVRVGSWNPHAGRISVSMREFAPDPWERIAEVYAPGMLIEGGVSGVTDFGAFVELMPGVEGLLHKSKIADEFVEYVDDYVREGDRIVVRLLDLDVDRRKAGVSMRDVPRDPQPELPASIFPGGPPWLPMPTAPGDEPASDAGDDFEGDDAADAAGNGWDDAPAEASADTFTAAAVTAAAVTAADTKPRREAPGIDDLDDLDDEGPAGPGAPYGDELALLFSLIDEHGAEGDLAEAVRDALERGITAFDARLDEEDEGSEDETEPIVQLRNGAADLLDALRVTDDDGLEDEAALAAPAAAAPELEPVAEPEPELTLEAEPELTLGAEPTLDLEPAPMDEAALADELSPAKGATLETELAPEPEPEAVAAEPESTTEPEPTTESEQAPEADFAADTDSALEAQPTLDAELPPADETTI